jgi:hypothetical protein
MERLLSMERADLLVIRMNRSSRCNLHDERTCNLHMLESSSLMMPTLIPMVGMVLWYVASLDLQDTHHSQSL